MMQEGEEEGGHALTRPQRRLLRRIYNRRTAPIIADGRPFPAYREASRYPQLLAADQRDAAYAGMKRQAERTRRPPSTPRS